MNVFLFNGQADGFYTAVFHAYPLSDAVIARQGFQLGIADELHEASVEEDKAERVVKKLQSISRNDERSIRLVLCNSAADAPQIAYRYLKLLLKKGISARDRRADPAVADFLDLLRQVNNETERMRGFLRFKECKGNVLYAPFSPDHDILEQLFPHFANRLNGEKFIIHDVRRKKAVFYRDGRAMLVPLSEAEIELSEQEADFERLWTEYYHAVDIRQRKNIRQMKNYLPVRYWKFLPEKNKIYSSSSKEDFPFPRGGE